MTRHTHRSVLRIVKSPKGILLIIFGALALLALASVQTGQALPNLIVAMGTAAAVDMAIVALRRDEWLFPDGALLTGLIVGFVLRPEEPAAIVMLASTVAIVSKQLIRTRWSNVFNPAAVGLVFATLV
ncbi:MAG TPA: RnfABCDGE type electron transport complex subunit D, partial [Dehalococcoidia bacterium]|nr:RnfABCDGE type electron transport complex subunit D [Dehalococcoidia bacterium]